MLNLLHFIRDDRYHININNICFTCLTGLIQVAPKLFPFGIQISQNPLQGYRNK